MPPGGCSTHRDPLPSTRERTRRRLNRCTWAAAPSGATLPLGHGVPDRSDPCGVQRAGCQAFAVETRRGNADWHPRNSRGTAPGGPTHLLRHRSRTDARSRRGLSHLVRARSGTSFGKGSAHRSSGRSPQGLLERLLSLPSRSIRNRLLGPSVCVHEAPQHSSEFIGACVGPLSQGGMTNPVTPGTHPVVLHPTHCRELRGTTILLAWLVACSTSSRRSSTGGPK